MRVGNEYNFVDFEIVEVWTEYVPSTRCSVKASGEGFSGELKSVWFSQENLDSFLADLQALEEKRRGTATLLNMSSLSQYSPLRFQISSTSDTGDFVVRADLLKITWIDTDTSQPLKLSIWFTIAQEMFPSIVIEFRKLFNVNSR
jgi:hypothetical protein